MTTETPATKIVVLDRDQTYLDEAEERLGAGFAFYAAQDLPMAVRMIKRLRPAILMVEVSSKEYDGVDLLIKLKAHLPSLVLVGILGEKEAETLDEIRKQTGDLLFLTRPLGIDLLTRTLREAALESRRRIPAAGRTVARPSPPAGRTTPTDPEPTAEEEEEEEEEAALALVKRIRIPSQPRLVMDLYREIKKPEPSFATITQLVNRDAGLAARIIRVVNSPYYGRSMQAKSVQQALTTLGLTNFYKVILTVALREVMTKGLQAGEHDRIWNHLTQVARTAEFVAIWMRSSVSPEQVYMAGLFHDCAISFLQAKKPGYKAIIFDELKCSHHTILEAESDFLGSNHALIGWWMARDWGISEEVCMAIRYHHHRLPPGGKTGETAAEIWMALRLAEYLLDTILLNQGLEPFEYLELEDPNLAGFREELLQRFGLTTGDLTRLQRDVQEIVTIQPVP